MVEHAWVMFAQAARNQRASQGGKSRAGGTDFGSEEKGGMVADSHGAMVRLPGEPAGIEWRCQKNKHIHTILLQMCGMSVLLA